MRLIVTKQPLTYFNGCEDFDEGEIEDYLVKFVSTCPSTLVLDNAIPEGEFTVGNYIELSDDAYIKPTNKTTLVAENYIEMLPNTLIEEYSIFEAKIEDCVNTEDYIDANSPFGNFPLDNIESQDDTTLFMVYGWLYDLSLIHI